MIWVHSIPPIVWIQAAAILFTLFAAKISAKIVTRYENKGATIHQMTLLHRYTFLIKLAYCIGTAAIFIPDLKGAAFSGLLAALWIYIIFDPLISIWRIPKRPWHYLGLNDADGRFWNGTFGKNAGKFKAAILAAALITTNILYYAYHL